MSRNCSWLNAAKNALPASLSTWVGVLKPRSERKRLRVSWVE